MNKVEIIESAEMPNAVPPASRFPPITKAILNPEELPPLEPEVMEGLIRKVPLCR